MMENSKNYESEEKPKKVFNLDLKKVYSKILGRDFVSYKFNKIILGTKRLISNNLNYNDFSKEYDECTKISSFKYPDINFFPISKNPELISLGKVRYSYDATKRSIQSTHTVDNKSISKNEHHNLFLKSNSISNKSKYISKIKINSATINKSNKPKLIELEYNSQSSKKLPKYKLLGSPIHKNLNNIKDNNQLSNNNSSIKYTSQYSSRSRKTYSSSVKNNLSNQNFQKRILIRNSFLNILNYKKYILNNRILLRDSLLNEKSYLNLEYDEEKIFMKTEHYNNFIKNRLDIIKSNNLRFDSHEKLEKIYEKSKFNHPKLVLKPIIIEFTKIFSFENKSSDYRSDHQIFEIPFEYTPIFYIYNFSKIKEILSCIFCLNEDLTKFNINYDNFSYLLQRSSEFNDSLKSTPQIFKRNMVKKTYTSKMKTLQSLSLNKAISSKVMKRGSVSSHLKETLKIIDIFNNDYNYKPPNNNPTRLIERYKNKSVGISYNNNSNKLYFCNKNCFEYIWLTPSFEYLVNIKTPEISFYLNDITINKKMDIELLFFLMENNFQDWDFYTIEYLFSFIKFVFIINNYLSIYKIKKFNFKNNFTLRNKIINLSEEKKLKYSRKNNKLEYIYTDERMNNHIKILHNYKILVYNKQINKIYQFCFHLNFIQMKALFFSIKKQGVKHLIEKILILDKDTMKIKLNYDYLDNFCKTDYNNLENLIQKNSKESQEKNLENKFDFSLNDTKVCLYYPTLESIKFKNKLPLNHKEDCFESNYQNELKTKLDVKILEKILKTSDLFKWPNIIEFIQYKKASKKNLDLHPGFSQKINIKSVIIKKQNLMKLNEEE